LVRWQNEGSFGCEAVACALGQPNVPECAMAINQIILSFLCSKFLYLSGFLRLCTTAGGCEQWGMAWRSVDIRR
jgi:hypothetical protein